MEQHLEITSDIILHYIALIDRYLFLMPSQLRRSYRIRANIALSCYAVHNDQEQECIVLCMQDARPVREAFGI